MTLEVFSSPDNSMNNPRCVGGGLTLWQRSHACVKAGKQGLLPGTGGLRFGKFSLGAISPQLLFWAGEVTAVGLQCWGTWAWASKHRGLWQCGPPGPCCISCLPCSLSWLTDFVCSLTASAHHTRQMFLSHFTAMMSFYWAVTVNLEPINGHK